MPNKHASIKDLRKSKKHAAHNTRIKDNVKSLFSKGKKLLVAGKQAEALQVYKTFQKAVDKAAKVGVFHKNFAAQKKSALMRLMNKQKV